MESLQQEVIIPIRISKTSHRGRTYFVHQRDYYVVTPLSKLLVKAYMMEKRLQENPDLTFREFCERSNITPGYLRQVLRLNNLSPKIKRMIMEGYQPKHLSIKNILRMKMPLLWDEQERVMLR